MVKDREKIMKSFTKHQSNFPTSNKDIFDVIFQRVKAANNGCTVFVPHVCNNIDSFGAGFAAQIAEKFPTVKANYHMLGKNFLQKNMGYTQVVQVYEDPVYKHKIFFANMIAQNGLKSFHNQRPLNYYYLCKAMNTLGSFINSNIDYKNNIEKVEIHCPRFGSGLAGGDWNLISLLIEDIWSDYDVFVYNYSKQNNINIRRNK